jgi:hypothetical protein
LIAPSLTVRAVVEPPGVSAQDARRAEFWLCGFVLFQIACQAALLFEALGSLRVLVRTAAFAASLALLVLLRGQERRHPARPWALAALAVVAFALLHPLTNSLQAGAAHFAMYVAIVAPLFWVARLRVTPRVLRRLLMILWIFHTLSAGLGVLQMHYPGQFQPNVSSTILGMGEFAEAYKLQLANGQSVWRPMGLTDTPGGAAGAGLYAVLFGLGFLIASRGLLLRGLSIGSLAVGLFCLYISEVRSLLVMAGICSLTLIAILMWRGELSRLVGIALVVPVLAVATFLWAVSVGGKSTLSRLSTLVEDRFEEVYARNRGHFLDHTFNVLLPENPLGAGLARWGMMRGYFGDEYNLESSPIWVEIQWTAWVLDGGVVLMLVYVVALLVACWTSLRVALGRLPQGVPMWGALVLALNVGALAVTFNHVIFMSQSGMEFWLLNAAVFAAAVQAAQSQRRRPPRPLSTAAQMKPRRELMPLTGSPA